MNGYRWDPCEDCGEWPAHRPMRDETRCGCTCHQAADRAELAAARSWGRERVQRVDAACFAVVERSGVVA